MNGIYLIIGGNMGNRLENLKICLQEIELKIGDIVKLSSIYETKAWGKEDESDYLNQVLMLETAKNCTDVLAICLNIEKRLGRVRNIKWESRIIDIDILFFNRDIIHLSNLEIPHPRIHQRKFVLEPLNEIAPNFVHPLSNKTVNELLAECEDKLEVQLYFGY